MFSERLEELRLKNQLSKKEFANKLEINPSQITRYVNESQNINSTTIIKICEIFNVSADWLLGLKNNLN